MRRNMPKSKRTELPIAKPNMHEIIQPEMVIADAGGLFMVE
jgi:hypothetical protein